jgi:DNA-directed RNA polymerase subunit RPC12/RpoP
MSNEENGLDSQVLSTQEFAARTIVGRFPSSSFKIKESAVGQIFEIYFQEKILLILDKRGAKYFFPTRRKRITKWEKISPAALTRLIEYILRDLAAADYEVLSQAHKPILKRPIHVSRYLRCPECKNGGEIKVIKRAEELSAEELQIYTPISRSVEINGAEIKCNRCGWMGIREELKRRIRRPRASQD